MATYLLVAHQTAESDELLGSARQLQQEDEDAKFVLLVPATPVTDLLTWEREETAEIARKKAAAASARLGQHGLRILEAKTGDQDPVAAIGDELRESRHRYAGIVLSTLPPGLSRWLNMDVISRAERSFPRHRVIHVLSAPPRRKTDTTA
jgi:hypothetical protein